MADSPSSLPLRSSYAGHASPSVSVAAPREASAATSPSSPPTGATPDTLRSLALAKRGGPKRDRTADLDNAIVALSQLSYGPSRVKMANRKEESKGVRGSGELKFEIQTFENKVSSLFFPAP
jgi:hypothetical protein